MLGGPEFVEKLDISEDEKQLILGGNAQQIYGID